MEIFKFRQRLSEGQYHYWGMLEEYKFVEPATSKWKTPALCEHDIFTGIEDKDGKEVYTNDVVNIWHFDEEPHEHVGGMGWVAYRPDLGQFVINDDHAKECYPINIAPLEVIGNLYDDPQLLEEPIS